MKKKYEKKLKKSVKEKRDVQIDLKQDRPGRPFLLGNERDCKIQCYLKTVLLRRGQITFAITVATTGALIKSNPDYILNMLDLTISFWTFIIPRNEKVDSY